MTDVPCMTYKVFGVPYIAQESVQRDLSDQC